MPVKHGHWSKGIAEDLSCLKGKCYKPYMNQSLTRKHRLMIEEAMKIQ